MSEQLETRNAEEAVAEGLVRPRGRRWLLTALGGAVAGFTASKLSDPSSAEAADGDEIHVGENHSGRRTTSLAMTDGGDQIGFRVTHTAFPEGLALGTTAIFGIGQGIFGAGVAGRSNHTGVRGEGENTGVDGTSSEGRGVHGTTQGSGPAFFPAAGGRFETFASNSIGAHALVRPLSGGDPPVGSVALLVEAPSGNTAARFIGTVQFLNNLDIVGNLDLNGTFLAKAAPDGGPAARFEGVTEFVAGPGAVAARFEGPTEFAGDVALTGSMVVNGTIAQSIAPGGGGPPVQSFAVQALDSWIEDFGEIPMAGQSDLRVTLPASFVAVADVSNYMVFVTAIGGDMPQVTSKDPSGFSLRAQNANKAPSSVCYRLVARPR